MTTFAMIDLGMQILKLLAVVGGVALGAFLGGLLAKMAARGAFQGKAPRLAVLALRVLGGATLGFLVWLWVAGSGGWGPGGGGLFGFGGAGTEKGSGTISTSQDTVSTALPPTKKTPESERLPETLRVEMLGGRRVKEERFYLLEGEKEPRTFTILRQTLAARKKQLDKRPLKGIEIVVYDNSVAKDHPAVRDLEKWARDNDLEVTMTLANRDMP